MSIDFKSLKEHVSDKENISLSKNSAHESHFIQFDQFCSPEQILIEQQALVRSHKAGKVIQTKDQIVKNLDSLFQSQQQKMLGGNSKELKQTRTNYQNSLKLKLKKEEISYNGIVPATFFNVSGAEQVPDFTLGKTANDQDQKCKVNGQNSDIENNSKSASPITVRQIGSNLQKFKGSIKAFHHQKNRPVIAKQIHEIFAHKQEGSDNI